MQTDWRDITHLAGGNSRQQAAYAALRDLRILDILRTYDLVLVGTLPIGVDVETSDLDIICAAGELIAFEREVTTAFASCEGFRAERKTVEDVPRLVADFLYAGFPIQVFGQPRPVEDQNGYRHMVIEARLLEIGRERAREEIRRLKRAGLKTEPAFALYFGLDGDPYQVLLELAGVEDEELRRRFNSPSGYNGAAPF